MLDSYTKTDGTQSQTRYYYVLNLQGDVVALMTASGNIWATYTYDAWGKSLQVLNGSNAALSSTSTYFANVNPLRYRGYYYDAELGFYYLQSRYYDPSIGRFVNADAAEIAALEGADLFETNLFAYCGNNPVTRDDTDGEFWHIAAGAVIGAAISAGVQIISNCISGNNWSDGVGSAMITGALGGALSASGVGLVGQIVGNAAISGISNIVSQGQSIRGGTQSSINWESLAFDTAVGGLCGVISGSGASSFKTTGGTKQMWNLGVKTVKRTWNAWRHKGFTAYVETAKKATSYYMSSTRLITGNLFSRRSGASQVVNAVYSWTKTAFTN